MRAQSSRWSPAPGRGYSSRAPMLQNGPRLQMGFIPLLIAAAEESLPWIIGIVVGGGALVGTSALLRSEYKSWKESIGINLANTPIAVLSGGAGAIAIVIAGNLDGTGKVIATSVGIAGIAGAIYALFTGTPPAPPPAGAEPKAPLTIPPATAPNPAPMLTPGPLARAFTINLVPSQPNTGGTTRQMWSDQDWEFVIRNETASPYSVYPGISIYDEGSQLVWKSPSVDSVYGRKLVTLSPGQDAPVILKSHSQFDWGRRPSAVAVQVDLFRNRDDSTPFMSSEAIPITMSYIG